MTSLQTRYRELIATSPRTRARDAAARLGVSEAALVAARCGTDDVVRLRGPWPELLRRLTRLGEVMALTRNEAVVHERTGTYAHVRVDEASGVGGVFATEIDLRVFTRRWAHAFATTVRTPRGVLRGLQIFDAHGAAVHKVYAREATDLAELVALIADHTHHDQGPDVAIAPAPRTGAVPAPVDATGFLAGWAALQDTHDFRDLLRTHGVGRRQALDLAAGSFTRPVDAVSSVRAVLEHAAATGLPVMVFVGNPGCLQIHGGPVHRVVYKDGWTNVLDPRFNLHVRDAALGEAWVVRKPTADGDVTALEVLLPGQDALAIQLFGLRKPGKPEDPAWRDALARATT